MGQLMFDEIRAEAQHLVENGARCSPEAVSGHFFFADAHAAHCRKDGVVAHRPLEGAGSWKYEMSLTSKRTQLSQDLHGLARERNDMRDVGLCCGVPPFRSVKVNILPLGRAQ